MASITVLVVGLLAFVATVTNTYVLARSSRQVQTANMAIVNVFEDFRAACSVDFTAALTTYSSGVALTAPASLGNAATLTATLILDESSVTPNIDLNDDGDVVDIGVTPADAKAGVLQVKIAWKGALGPMSLEYTSVVARGNFQ